MISDDSLDGFAYLEETNKPSKYVNATSERYTGNIVTDNSFISSPALSDITPDGSPYHSSEMN